MSEDPSLDLSRDAVVGVLGGTGPQGLGLARRWAAAGVRVVIGSRSADRAAEAAALLPGSAVGTDNTSCALSCDIAVVAVPYEGHRALLTSLKTELVGKVVIDCVNPLGFDGKGPFAVRVPDGSACEEAQTVLPDSRVTGAFHHLSAVHLNDPAGTGIDCDVLVVGDDRQATDLTQRLAEKITGVRAVYAGRLRNAHQIEALTANLIAVNRRYKVHAGLRVTDIAEEQRT